MINVKKVIKHVYCFIDLVLEAWNTENFAVCVIPILKY